MFPIQAPVYVHELGSSRFDEPSRDFSLIRTFAYFVLEEQFVKLFKDHQIDHIERLTCPRSLLNVVQHLGEPLASMTLKKSFLDLFITIPFNHLQIIPLSFIHKFPASQKEYYFILDMFEWTKIYKEINCNLDFVLVGYSGESWHRKACKHLVKMGDFSKIDQILVRIQDLEDETIQKKAEIEFWIGCSEGFIFVRNITRAIEYIKKLPEGYEKDSLLVDSVVILIENRDLNDGLELVRMMSAPTMKTQAVQKILEGFLNDENVNQWIEFALSSLKEAVQRMVIERVSMKLCYEKKTNQLQDLLEKIPDTEVKTKRWIATMLSLVRKS